MGVPVGHGEFGRQPAAADAAAYVEQDPRTVDSLHQHLVLRHADGLRRCGAKPLGGCAIEDQFRVRGGPVRWWVVGAALDATHDIHGQPVLGGLEGRAHEVRGDVRGQGQPPGHRRIAADRRALRDLERRARHEHLHHGGDDLPDGPVAGQFEAGQDPSGTRVGQADVRAEDPVDRAQAAGPAGHRRAPGTDADAHPAGTRHRGGVACERLQAGQVGGIDGDDPDAMGHGARQASGRSTSPACGPGATGAGDVDHGCRQAGGPARPTSGPSVLPGATPGRDVRGPEADAPRAARLPPWNPCRDS